MYMIMDDLLLYIPTVELHLQKWIDIDLIAKPVHASHTHMFCHILKFIDNKYTVHMRAKSESPCLSDTGGFRSRQWWKTYKVVESKSVCTDLYTGSPSHLFYDAMHMFGKAYT
jgi:hypothetical protein